MAKSPSSEASHESGDEQHEGLSSSKIPTLKDKECQYCHQKFTSSSLGRHLDQFISKKKPDGIHDVDEIRRMRGGITRRTARNSKKEPDETDSVHHSPSPQYTLPSYSELVTKTANAPSELRFNRMNWQATGVITDTTSLNPPTANITSPPLSNGPANPPVGTKRNYSTYTNDLPAFNPTTSETTRALELSLREVLDVVRSVTKRVTPPPNPFPVDVTSQTFPQLCLALLPVPATLFTPSPFATTNSLPLLPPGIDQYQTLRKTIEYRIDQWKWTRLAYVQRTAGTVNFSDEADNVSEMAVTEVQGALDHLEMAYRNFMSFSPESRQSLWTIEVLRAFKTEQDRVSEANAKIQQLLQESDQLQQQIDHLSRCQWPREMALWPPDRVTLDEKMKAELCKVNLVKSEMNNPNDGLQDGSGDDQPKDNLDRWDYTLLVNKWKKHVREDRTRRTGIQPSMPFISGAGPPSVPDNHVSATSEHSAVSTPRLASGMAKPSIVDHRASSAGQHKDVASSHESPLINGIGSNGSASLSGFDSRRRNIQVISDVDDIFTPRLRGLRADGLAKSATP